MLDDITFWNGVVFALVCVVLGSWYVRRGKVEDAEMKFLNPREEPSFPNPDDDFTASEALYVCRHRFHLCVLS
jgi:hypothetical protein